MESRSGCGVARIICACMLVTSLVGCATSSSAYRNQRAFKDANSAVEALVLAADVGDMAALEEIFGPDGRQVLSSGDPVADGHQREVFVVAMGQGWTLENMDSSTKELIVGAERWPFPIPLVKDSHGWWFDTEAGAQEVVARRIGRNELATIGVLQTYVVSQLEYAAEGHDGKPAGIYARKVMSSPGMHDGLYWPDEGPDADPSPLGQFAAEASAEGYSTDAQTGPKPFHGYHYRILTERGSAAPGGAGSYIVNGEMTGGFAMIAYPAEYGNSGIMSFIVGTDGIVSESDLGEDTTRIASGITEYNPDGTWSVVP